MSPVLTDTQETWRTIEKICEVAKSHGASIDQRCGAHVHIGITPLDTARQRWKRLFRAIGSFEDVIYRFSGGNLGRIRSNHSRYATSFSDRARSTARSRFNLNDRSDIDTLARNASNNNRYYGVNFTNIYKSDKPNTVEFRYFNGSLDAGQIQANVKVANGIIIAAEKARTRSTANTPTTETMVRRGRILEESFSSRVNRNDHSAIARFVDVIFPRKKDKDAAIAVCANNQWAY